MRIQFYVLCTPDEVLKSLIDESERFQWDRGLTHASQEDGVMTLKYGDLEEKIKIIYLTFEKKFYIVEQINSPQVAADKDESQIPDGSSVDYERMWICEQV